MVACSRRSAPFTMVRRLVPLHLALAVGLWVAPARATPICVDVGDQANVMIVPDGSGGAVLVWEDGRHGYDAGLRAQHLLSTGEVDPAWPLNGRALTAASSTQSDEQAVSDGAGGMVVAWVNTTYLPGLYVQHMRASGTVDPAWPASGVPLPNGDHPR